MWAKVQDGALIAYPYGPTELKRDNPNTSFPDIVSNELLAEWGIVPVDPRDPPTHDPVTQNCVRVDPVLENGAWIETWVVSPASAEEIEQRRNDARQGMRLSFAQLMIGLVTEQWITEAEGDAWLAGTLPFAVLTVIDSLPAEQRFAAKARAIRPSEVLRSDPLVAAMGAAAGKTAAEMDTFFQTYAGV